MKKFISTFLLVVIVMFARAQDPAYPAALPAAQHILAAEYFIDTDPGNGNGTVIAVTPAGTINNATTTINVTGLSNGVHRLYLRTKNTEGSWSIVNIRDFLYDTDIAYTNPLATAQNVIAAEYFIDTDPGYGNGTPILVTPALDLSNVSVTVNTTGLTDGTHRIYLRTRNNEGAWSIAQVKEFVIDFDFAYPATLAAAQNMIAAEYFIDTDPGNGAGIAIPVTAGTDLNNVSPVIITSELANGTHRLYIRTRNIEGAWSITHFSDFIVDTDPGYPAPPAAAQNIIAAEYFIDTDPGNGAGIAIPVTAGIDLTTISPVITTSGLSNGSHTLYLRTRSQQGAWSITNRAVFFTDLVALSDDTLHFVNTPVTTTTTQQLIITNNSNSTLTISSIVIGGAFTVNATAPLSIAANAADTLTVSFMPLAAMAYTDSIVLQTTAGRYRAVLQGTGIAQTASWSIDPAGGNNYGNIALNTTANFNFTIRNTGNIDIRLGNVIIANAAFVPTFSAGTIIPVNGSMVLPVTFTPVITGAYTAQLKIKSPDTDSVTTIVSGNGYAPGALPVLNYISPAPYSNNNGVNPAVGQAGLYTYKVLYTSSNNRPPQAGYPKLGVDLTGDGDFNDLGEGLFNMVKEGSSNDYTSGVVYTYTFRHDDYNNMAGYQFFAMDDNGNTATATAYKSGPVVTNQQLDLRIFANDISFSKNNPLPGESFTLTATVTNSTAVPAINVPVRFYRDTILMGTGTIFSVPAFGTGTINKTFSFAEEGFFPIKVWIDSSNTLGDYNVLNNYAIRPVTVGSPVLPGGITATTSASIQVCPQLTVLISGTASYFGTGSTTAVAGSTVTINTGTQLITTTTDAAGNYSYLLAGVSCGAGFTYTVSVTDFTFTSATITNSMPLDCPSPNACTPPPSQGGVIATLTTSGCSNTVGSAAGFNLTVQYRERDVNNMWSPFDDIINDTLRVFRNGVLVQTLPSADFAHAPGEVRVIPVSLPLSSADPVNISAILSYTYVEYKQIPSSIYHGERTALTATGGGSVQPELNLPDLSIQNFVQTGFTAFSFDNANIKCGDAGAHTEKIFDSIPGGPLVLVKTSNIPVLDGGLAVNIGFSDPMLTPGTHFIKIITDSENTVAEQSETNNEFRTSIEVPKPDLIVAELRPAQSALPIGSSVQFIAKVKNTGTATSDFSVRFTVNNIQLGATKRIRLNESASVDVLSDAYTVNYPDNACGLAIAAYADSNGGPAGEIDESSEGNNSRAIILSGDLATYQLAGEVGSIDNPAIVRVNTNSQFFTAIRNIGSRDVKDVTVRFSLAGNRIGADTISMIKAGEVFTSYASFSHLFTQPGDYLIKVLADTLNTICESDETNNEGDFHIRVVDSKQDLEVLSQYISPSSLNPNSGQNITIVGTVRNTGGKPSTASVLRFLVDEIQLGADVPLNALRPGTDTTVAATATYSSLIPGVKIIKLIADPLDVLEEELEGNNEATRAIIVGEAPDMVRSQPGAIRFNPNGFSAGDSVMVSYSIRNNGARAGTAWVRFQVQNTVHEITAIDSVQFTLAGGANMIVSKKMLFDTDRGNVITQIVNCTPQEFDLLNNNDTLAFSTVMKLKSNTLVSTDLDMKDGLPDQLPGWIGGKLILGDYDLTVTGKIINFDSSRYVITNGSGKLKLVNTQAENIFPVGVSVSSSNFLKLNNAGTADNFTVSVAPYVLQSGHTGDTIRSGYVNRSWFIEEQVPGGSNATAELFWNQPDELPGFNRMQSRVAHFISSWQLGLPGAALTDSIGRYSRLQSGYNSFSPFSVTSETGTALPLRLMRFTTVLQGAAALLEWQAMEEVNTARFIIQHSLNGQTFEDIGTVAAINRPGINSYSFTHASIANGSHYYRLKMVDIDGRFTYSLVNTVRKETGLVMQVYPNPASQFVQVRGIKANAFIEITALDGRVIRRVKTTGNAQLIDISDMAAGVYVVIYVEKGRVQQEKIVKR